ncbi:unconventional myosin-IXa-like isoform X5 [Ostrea edulis]|uniref:unconventional myosin-IXa-like isoform X5 n=1 Tax=Ostrea edulis TaxID=37623 RepID=UPI0024AEDD50|nr:unconventional myosin-IXa-like isoform X5 [Ostrea edulis]
MMDRGTLTLSSASAISPTTHVGLVRRTSMETYMVRIYPGPLYECDYTSIEAEKCTAAVEILKVAVKKLQLGNPEKYELAEVLSSGGQLCKERRLEPTENPVRIMLLWPKMAGSNVPGYKFFLRKKDHESVNRTSSWREISSDPSRVDSFLLTFLKQPTNNKEYPDLCNLPDLNEMTLLENIKNRFEHSHIYTYVGSILIAVNPFKFFPIYNPKYVKMYQNRRLGELPPHIFATADAAFYTMLRKKKNQCIVISGESGSGKTESTNLLLHHLTALSQKGSHGSGVEQTILGAGPVLEAFGNAKTVHNNNSSRFGKFIQVNYKENGMVHGAIVEKYLLEKSRIVSQAKNERNYHVFYYLLAGADEQEREALHLRKPEEYHYLRQSGCYTLEGEDEVHEFVRLKQSMEMVGFSSVTQKRIFSVMSAVLLLGNVEFKKKGDQHHDESVTIKHQTVIQTISSILKVKEKTLVEALTQKRATAGDETVVMNYRMHDAIATRDAMAKCLYGALFDWIVLKVNQALLAKRHNSDHQDVFSVGNSIGVLDIFGFEDFSKNSFEQFSINYANEHLQYYFNQHIFKFEQEEYKKEGIQWKNIEFIDNTGCLDLFSKRPDGLFCLLDEECNFPGATNETLLSKFNHHHKGKTYYQVPNVREEAFAVLHYAGKVKYQIKDFREKNVDQVRPDIVSVLKSSNLSFLRELMGLDPVAVLRWSIIKTLVKSVFAFIAAGRTYRSNGGVKKDVQKQNRKNSFDFNLVGGENLLNSQHKRGHQLYSPVHILPGMDDSGLPDEDNVFLDLPCSPSEVHMSDEEIRIYRRAKHVMLKNKSFRPKPRPPTMLRDIKTLKAIASRTMCNKITSKKQAASVSAQFQWSLSKLMTTLQQANPFFIRCIKSNAEKEPCTFNDVLVLRQLRYTGMLATVKIRQSGYNYRLTFEEFIQLYKIILPKGLLSSKEDVATFLESNDLDKDNYQIGITKVFLRESEKIFLDESLHSAIMLRVVRIQRWFKSILERRHFVALRTSCVVIQTMVRMYLSRQRRLKLRRQLQAVVTMQRYLRGWRTRRCYLTTINAVILIQSWYKGWRIRRQYRSQIEEALEQRKKREEEERQRQKQADTTSDEGVLSTEELDQQLPSDARRHSESSGIHEVEDSESDTVDSKIKEKSTSYTSPVNPPTIVLVQPTIKLPDDEFLKQARSTSRVSSLAKSFQEPSSPSPTPLSPSRLKILEETLSKSRDSHGEPPQSPLSDFAGAHKSPFRKARRHFKNFVGEATSCMPPIGARSSSLRFLRHRSSKRQVKKDGGPADDSDEETPPVQIKPKRPHKLGVQVLPTEVIITQPSPASPTDVKSADDQRSSSEDLRRKGRKKQRHKQPLDKKRSSESPVRGNWKVEGTSEWQYPADLVITEFSEFANLDIFIYKKLKDYNKDYKKETIFDKVFKRSLNAFHKEMQATISIEKQKGEIHLPYRNLLTKFALTLEAEVKVERTNASFPVTMGVNAFRGFLDEFIKHHKKEKKKQDKKVDNKTQKQEKVKKDLYEYLGHKYSLTQFGIPTFCEFCSNIIWIMEKGSVCQVCRYTCHKRCVNKSTSQCKGAQDNQATRPDKRQPSPISPHLLSEPFRPRVQSLDQARPTVLALIVHLNKMAQNPGSKVYGVPLASLVSDERKIPVIVERLIVAIETHGMYTIGVYRKSGANAKVKQLKQNIDSGKEDLTAVDIDEYPIHTLTTMLKYFFRELPEPLLTFELYDDFLRTAEIQDEKERVQAIYAVIDKLPKPNYNLLERLIFHLARIANNEALNKMSPNGLAIIFAPALLRTNKKLQAQDTLNQVPRQTAVIKQVITEQLLKMKETFSDLSTLETAEVTAADRLHVVRLSMRARSPVHIPPASPVTEVASIEEETVIPEEIDVEEAKEEEKALCSHIRSIQKERENLTTNLPALECRHLSSDDDGLSTDGPDSIYDTADEEENEEYALTFDLPVSPPSQLQHLTKKRVSGNPCKRPPKRYRPFLDKRGDQCFSCSSDDFSDPLESTVDDSMVSYISEGPTMLPIAHTREPSWESSSVSIPALHNICEDEDEIMV